MTPQETFNTVYLHLTTQMKKSATSDRSCFYYGPDNLKCAIGCLIPNEAYNQEFEREAVVNIAKSHPSLAWMLGQLPLLENLRVIHDHFRPEKWAEELQYVAHIHGLSIPSH